VKLKKKMQISAQSRHCACGMAKNQAPHIVRAMRGIRRCAHAFFALRMYAPPRNISILPRASDFALPRGGGLHRCRSAKMSQSR